MNRLNTATRGIASWRARLADPERQWLPRYSAFEAAVSWELAARTETGLPEPIRALLATVFASPNLLLAIVEHKVGLLGGNADSQNDVWGLVKSNLGTVSLSVEAKACESFGSSLSTWLEAGTSVRSRSNREARWRFVRDQLPAASEGAFSLVAYQLLHRCASAVIEARRFGLNHAACIVQAFNTPAHRFEEFAAFCHAIGGNPPRGCLYTTKVKDICLAVGWADCPLATEQEVAAVE